MMIYITQLIYVIKGKESVFNEFESKVLPILPNYNGSLLIRIRPDRNDVIESSIETPYEIHLVKFDSEEDFQNFANDNNRKSFLHLKEQSIRSILLIKGSATGG
jgi:hypothetical protein